MRPIILPFGVNKEMCEYEYGQICEEYHRQWSDMDPELIKIRKNLEKLEKKIDKNNARIFKMKLDHPVSNNTQNNPENTTTIYNL